MLKLRPHEWTKVPRSSAAPRLFPINSELFNTLFATASPHCFWSFIYFPSNHRGSTVSRPNPNSPRGFAYHFSTRALLFRSFNSSRGRIASEERMKKKEDDIRFWSGRRKIGKTWIAPAAGTGSARSSRIVSRVWGAPHPIRLSAVPMAMRLQCLLNFRASFAAVDLSSLKNFWRVWRAMENETERAGKRGKMVNEPTRLGQTLRSTVN